MQTFEKEYTYTASELDSKSSCRAIALEQVKRILLQELGVYVEGVFNDKASTDERTKDEVRREITTLSAGVASTEVVEEKWDGTTYWLKARIKADPDDVAKKIEALRQDKQKVAELEESRKRAEELSQELERMRNELDATKSALAKAEQTKKYNDTAQQLSAVDWLNKGDAYWAAFQSENATSAYSRAIELNPKYALAYYRRGFVYTFIYGSYQLAINDLSKAIELGLNNAFDNADAFYERGDAYLLTGNFQEAIKDYGKAIQLFPKDVLGEHWRWNAYIKRASLYNELGDYKSAIKDFNKVIERDPKGASTYSSRGDAYHHLGDKKQAIEDYKVAARLGDAKAQNFLKKQGIAW